MSPQLLAQIDIATPLNNFGNYDNLVGDLVSKILLFIIPIAGIYFFVRLVTAGLNMMSSLGDPGKIQAAQVEISHAFFGLLIVISGFFVAQIVEIIFGLDIL